jgi:hypothetical protein
MVCKRKVKKGKWGIRSEAHIKRRNITRKVKAKRLQRAKHKGIDIRGRK